MLRGSPHATQALSLLVLQQHYSSLGSLQALAAFLLTSAYATNCSGVWLPDHPAHGLADTGWMWRESQTLQ
jgi:hypothetical protein